MGRNTKTFFWTTAAVMAALAFDGYLNKNVAAYRQLTS